MASATVSRRGRRGSRPVGPSEMTMVTVAPSGAWPVGLQLMTWPLGTDGRVLRRAVRHQADGLSVVVAP